MPTWFLMFHKRRAVMSTLRDSIDRLARWAIRAVLVLQVGCLSAWWLARKIQHGTHPRIEAVPAEVLGMSCSHRQTCKHANQSGALGEFVRASKVFVAPGSCSSCLLHCPSLVTARYLYRNRAGRVEYQRLRVGSCMYEYIRTTSNQMAGEHD